MRNDPFTYCFRLAGLRTRAYNNAGDFLAALLTHRLSDQRNYAGTLISNFANA